MPKIQNTKLGWVIAGPIGVQGWKNKPVCNLTSNLEIQGQLKKFWMLEEFPDARKFSKDEVRCQEIFRDTTVRDGNGKFIVGLPMKENKGNLGNSLNTALRRFAKLEKWFLRDESLREQYFDFMKTYLDLGHMSKVGNLTDLESCGDDNTFYLPHHGVLKETSQTTKLRTVFDASAASTSGVSLNDILLVGPTLQDNLFNILIRFRQHQVVISGDIEKMYRQVLVRENQRNLQRIIFRFSPCNEVTKFSVHQLIN